MNNKQLIARFILSPAFEPYRAFTLSSVRILQLYASNVQSSLSDGDAERVILSCSAYATMLNAGYNPSADDYKAIVMDMLQ